MFIIVILSAISCSSNKLTVTVIFSVQTDEGEEVLLETELKIGTKDNAPTALQAAEQALMENQIPYSLSPDKSMLTSAFNYTEYEEQSTEYCYTGYEWGLTINDCREAPRLASETSLNDGDVIKYTWMSYNKIV